MLAAFASSRLLSRCCLVVVIAGALLGVPALAQERPRASAHRDGPQGNDVSVALILAVDVSASINGERFQLQREGYARAVRHPAVLEAILASQRRQIALSVVEWASADAQRVVVPWTVVASEDDAERIAAALLAAPRSFDGLTAIGEAIAFSARQFDVLGVPADRRVIDVSGDGVNNDGGPPSAARDAAIARGITINGLVIMEPIQQVVATNREQRLDDFYRENVVGGQGAFLIAVEEFESFSYALVAKIVREVADAGPPVSVASAASARF